MTGLVPALTWQQRQVVADLQGAVAMLRHALEVCDPDDRPSIQTALAECRGVLAGLHPDVSKIRDRVQ